MVEKVQNYHGIKEQFDRVLSWSQGFTHVDTDYLFREWQRNKQPFIEWFGGDLIHEFGEVEFHIDQNKKSEIIDTFLNQAAYALSEREYSDFYQFVKANKDSFFENLVSNTQLTFGKDIKIGMKLSKAFKFFISDKDQLNTIQQLASKYIQQDKIKGTLCVSVHPLDFLSASETTYNWRSCHSLDGEYRAGNLSYMADTVTFMWYLRGEDQVVLPNFPPDVKWNGKKWRMLCYLDETWQHCFLGRQYPFDLEGIPQLIRQYLPGEWMPFTDFQLSDFPVPEGQLNLQPEQDNFFTRFGYNERDYFALNGSFIALRTSTGTDLFKITNVVQDDPSKLHYNDLLYSSYYKPYYSSKVRIDKPGQPKLHVGHEVPCIMCGSDVIVNGEGHMLCSNCAHEYVYDDSYQCAVCGEWYDPDDMTYLHNGDVVCPRCVENGDIHYCAECGEWFYDDELIYSHKFNTWYCRRCFEEVAEEEMQFRKENHLEED